jgi:hypothetical protein
VVFFAARKLSGAARIAAVKVPRKAIAKVSPIALRNSGRCPPVEGGNISAINLARAARPGPICSIEIPSHQIEKKARARVARGRPNSIARRCGDFARRLR